MSLSRNRSGPRIFLSSAHRDADAARELRVELQRRGASVWTPEELNVAARSFQGVEEAIRRSDAFLVLVSGASEESSWVQSELAMAMRVIGAHEARKVIAVVLEGAPLPPELAEQQALHVRGDDWSVVVDNLLERPRGEIAEADFEQEVDDALEEMGAHFDRAPIVGGVRPDFLVEGPRDGLLVIEVKAWDGPALINAAHALNQVSYIAGVVGADRGLLVVNELRMGLAPPSIVPIAGLPAAIRSWWEQRESSAERAPRDRGRAPRQIFAAMPFAPEYSDSYWVAMAGAAEAVGAACVRVDQTTFTGDIVARIESDIRASDAVIADLSESVPNVLYELGFARALGKPAIQICSTPLDELPFDVRNLRTLTYRRGQTHQLTDVLAAELEAIL